MLVIETFGQQGWFLGKFLYESSSGGTRDSISRVPATKKKKSDCPNTNKEGVLEQCEVSQHLSGKVLGRYREVLGQYRKVLGHYGIVLGQ